MSVLGSNLTVSPNCNSVSMDATEYDGETGYIANLYLVEGDTTTQIFQSTAQYSSPMTITFENLTNSEVNLLYGQNETPTELDAIIEGITSFNGLFNFTLIDNIEEAVETPASYVLGTCAIDCCMANLLNPVINCNCEGGDCHDTIRKIEKILILIRCAVVDAANGDIAAAQEKYNKAAELCDSTCDCNC
jgi:hypothetical protein